MQEAIHISSQAMHNIILSVMYTLVGITSHHAFKICSAVYCPFVLLLPLGAPATSPWPTKTCVYASACIILNYCGCMTKKQGFI